MIVLNKHPGQLCNRLWAYVPYITLSLKDNHKLLILHFDEYYHQFENLRVLPGIRIGEPYVVKKNHYWKWLFLHIAKPLPLRLLHYFNVYPDNEFWEQGHAALADRNTNIIFIRNRENVRRNALLPEYQEQIRQLFRPKQVYVEKVTQLVQEQREKYDVVVGVHIRRSDYKRFLRGAYYFDDATYCAYMANLELELKEAGKSVVFLLCSDEPLQLAHFSQFNTFRINRRADIEDLYALGLADYIMGVPSAFSMWASFYGKVPLRILQHKKEKLHLHEFSVIVSQNEFENGMRFRHREKHYFPSWQRSTGALEPLPTHAAFNHSEQDQQRMNT
ncbi:hypothetical protein GCM10023188_35070 [Pontibacter saemangeumensis]|uniref:Glycosyl transferase family 11 n=1 Tax=Pontibacter saemangeumensis TaxID=1084525 RepID=A0ABP8LY20_9BACT